MSYRTYILEKELAEVKAKLEEVTNASRRLGYDTSQELPDMDPPEQTGED